MKISNVTPLVLGTSWRNLIFLKVETDEGVVGYGEATLHNKEEGVLGYLEGAKRRHILGSDPFNIEDLWMRMYRDEFWRGGIISLTVMSGIEIACWDIIGKTVNLPIYKLLGGQCRDKLKAYANGWYTVERDPGVFAERVKTVIDKGYKALKLDPFGAGRYELDRKEKMLSIELVEAVRDAVGDDVEIMIEAHGRFSAQTALEMAKALEPFDPAWFEEPVPPENLEVMKKAAAKIDIPVATGERIFTRYGYRDLLEAQVADVIQPDIIHAGGILEMKKIAAMADANYVTVAPHNSQGPVCTTASVHFDFTITNFKIQEIFDDFQEPYLFDAVVGSPRVRDGFITPPEGPGLGIELNEDVIKEHPLQEGFFNLFATDWHMRQFAR